MKATLFVLLSALTAVLAAPAPEPEPEALEPRAYSCNIASDGCYISCRGGSKYIDCSASYCKASGTAGPYGTCVCKCHY